MTVSDATNHTLHIMGLGMRGASMHMEYLDGVPQCAVVLRPRVAVDRREGW